MAHKAKKRGAKPGKTTRWRMDSSSKSIKEREPWPRCEKCGTKMVGRYKPELSSTSKESRAQVGKEEMRTFHCPKCDKEPANVPLVPRERPKKKRFVFGEIKDPN